MSFKEKKYEVIPNAISYELANFAFNYFKGEAIVRQILCVRKEDTSV